MCVYMLDQVKTYIFKMDMYSVKYISKNAIFK